jgi:hypothetical protein
MPSQWQRLDQLRLVPVTFEPLSLLSKLVPAYRKIGKLGFHLRVMGEPRLSLALGGACAKLRRFRWLRRHSFPNPYIH